MIVSQEYKYVFVELPHTASTAISRELCENYIGKSILHKHSHYSNFLQIASEEEKSFLVIASIRNPLDIIVTRYFKVKTNHGGFFTDPKYRVKSGGHVSRKVFSEFRFIQEHNADYATYFRRFFRYPFDSWGCPSPEDFDFVIRYENLQNDFARFLKMLNIPQVRSIPLTNKTAGKDDDFWTYYPPEVRNQAIWFFGPYLDLWGYEFPSDWGDVSIPRLGQWGFALFRLIRKTLIKTGLYFKAV